MDKQRMIYLDQASSSSPKAEGLGEVMAAYFAAGGYNIARGHYPGAEKAARSVLETRRLLASYFHIANFRNIVFTNNITHALNLVLKGFLHPGDEIITSSMEHNAVMRPLQQLAQGGVKFRLIPCDEEGRLDYSALPSLIRQRTRALVINAASNICGTCQDIFRLSEFCRKYDLFYIVDSAQVAGHFPLDLKALDAAAFCFTGHKALQGPQGIGGVVLREDLAQLLDPLISGGTGSYSALEEMPPHLPDRFEAGTPNLPGILGLGHAVKIKLQAQPFANFARETELLEKFLQGLEAKLPPSSYRLRGRGLAAVAENRAFLAREEAAGRHFAQSMPGSMPVVSLDFPGEDNAEIAYKLEDRYGIMTRCGLHCAPRAHQSIKTFPQGTVRFSFSYQNSKEDLEQALEALAECLS